MEDRHEALWRALEESLLRAEAHTRPEERQAARAGQSADPELAALIDKIRRKATEVTDEDLARLRARRSQDELFELVIAAAFGAGRDRLQAALRAVDEA
jgi:hypothetical protein